MRSCSNGDTSSPVEGAVNMSQHVTATSRSDGRQTVTYAYTMSSANLPLLTGATDANLQTTTYAAAATMPASASHLHHAAGQSICQIQEQLCRRHEVMRMNQWQAAAHTLPASDGGNLWLFL